MILYNLYSKIFLYLSIIILFNCDIFAQSSNSYIVISNKLNVRDKPSMNSNIIGVLENGETVKVIGHDRFNFENYDCESVNDYEHCWREITFNQKKGYVHSLYLGTKYMLFYEDAYIHYYPKVKYWYGVYRDSISQKEVLRKIEPFVKNLKHESDVEHDFLITNNKQKSLFIIATNTLITEREMGVFTRSQNKENDYYNNLKPGVRQWLYSQVIGSTVAGPLYELITTGDYFISDYGLATKNIEFYVYEGNFPNLTKIQNITKFTRNKEHVKIEYFGDIDGDYKPDIIIQASSHNSHNSILLLSSEAGPKDLLEEVSLYSHYIYY